MVHAGLAMAASYSSFLRGLSARSSAPIFDICQLYHIKTAGALFKVPSGKITRLFSPCSSRSAINPLCNIAT
jgi:hypothetical protein